MSPYAAAISLFYSFLAVSGLLLLGWANALDDDFESEATTTEASSSPFFSNSMFTKLKESLSGVNWNDYLEVIKENVSDRANTSASINASDNIYLDPNGPSVQFILFTNESHRHNMKVDNHQDFVKSGFNFDNPTKIITHGFLSSTKFDVFQLNKDAYLASGNYNVIGMDWSVLCEFEYFTAMRGAQIAGIELGNFINWLVKEGVSPDSIHLVGHSLGAHVVAMGAAKLKDGVKVGRITGLDPAGPGYDQVPPVYRLDASDAKLVDVVHTNMRVLSLPKPQGHVDFYPNGGRFQPGCPYMYDIWTLGESVECNHGRAYHYFAESIRNKRAFKSFRCPTVESANMEMCTTDTDVYMGQEETYQYGLFYFKTADKSPFSLNADN